MAYLILAGLATPLVLSVHSIVSMDFAVAQLPGWHTTIFPPYFVAGAIFSGFAMVVTLMVITRKGFGLENIVTLLHFDNMAKIMLVTGMIVGYAYAMEFFIAWYSQNPYEQFTFMNRAFGPYWWAYWTMITCNVLVAAGLLVQEGAHQHGRCTSSSRSSSTSACGSSASSIIVTSLHRDFLPSSWGMYYPTIWDDLDARSGASASSSRCSCCSSASCRWWRRPR